MTVFRSRRRNTLAVAAVALASLVGAPGRAQTAERVISGSPRCTRCTLTLKHVATLGDPNDPILLSEGILLPAGITPDGSYLADAFTRAEILLFAPSGKLQRVVGRAGQGPNEFPRVSKWFLRARDDTTYIIASGQLFVLNSALREVRRISVPVAPNYAVLRDGSLVAMTSIYSAEPPVRVHVVTASGEKKGPFIVRDSFPQRDPCSKCRHLSFAAAAGAGDFWFLHSAGFVLRRWTSNGRLAETVRVNGSPWYDKWLADMRNGWAHPGDKMPALKLNSRSDGLLLVSAIGPTSVGNASARAPLPAVKSIAVWSMAMEPALDQVFDIVDPAVGVLASARAHHKNFVPMDDGRHLMRLVESRDGITQIEIWELVFSRG